jgi:glutathione S-transferase
MSEPLVFYTNPQSRGRIIRWMLEEAGCAYETEVLDYGTTMKAPDYLAVNPMGKVPAIRHGDTVVTEAAAICAYLADASSDAGLAPPPGNPTRGPYYRWMFFASGPVEAVITGKALGLLAPADKKAMAGYGSYEEVLDALEGAVPSEGWLCGEQFTAADLYVSSQLAFGIQFGILEKRAAFEAYIARATARPAYARANEIDNALLAEAQASSPAQEA